MSGCTIDCALLGAQCSLWRRPRHARQSATPVRHDSSAMEYHNGYAVDPTVYASTYTISTGASPMAQVNTPLGQRVYRAMKRIQQKILNQCSSVNVFFVVYYTSSLGPPVGVQHLCTRLPCAIKGRRPLEKNSSLKRTWRQRIDSSTDTRAIQLSVDVGYYAPAARTTLNSRVFLRSCFMSRSDDSIALP